MSLIDASSSSSIDEDDTELDHYDTDKIVDEGYLSSNVSYRSSQLNPASKQTSDRENYTNYDEEAKNRNTIKETVDRKNEISLRKQYSIKESFDMDRETQQKLRFSDTVQKRNNQKCCTKCDLADDCQNTTIEGTRPKVEQHVVLQNEILILNCHVEMLKLEKMQALRHLKETNKKLAVCQKENEASKTEAVKLANSLKKKIRELTSIIQEFKTARENTDQIANLEHVQCAVKQKDRHVKTLENHLVITKLDSDVKGGYLGEILNQIAIMEKEFDIKLCEKEAEVQKFREQFLEKQTECELAVSQQQCYIEDLEGRLDESREETLSYRKDNAFLRMSLEVAQSELSNLYSETAELKGRLEAIHYERNDLENRCIELYETVSNLEARIITEKEHYFPLNKQGIENEVEKKEKSD